MRPRATTAKASESRRRVCPMARAFLAACSPAFNTLSNLVAGPTLDHTGGMPPKYPPVRALCLHGHFYQPPREHPWLGVVGPEASAALRRADVASHARTGHGNAWASAYGHPILPLSTPRDVRTQVRWGRRDFEHRFGRAPEGMWLPEMAVDGTALAAFAEAGITLALLAPHQARRIRPLGAGDGAWTAVTPESLDVRRLYRCLVPGGGFVDVLFRKAALSHGVAFGAHIGDGVELARRIRAALVHDGSIVAVAVDGETYGHHHRFGEM